MNDKNIIPDKTKINHIPDDANLADRWKETHPVTIWTAGKFKRRKNNQWVTVERDVILKEILHVMEAAAAEGYRTTAERLSSVSEFVRLDMSTSTDELIVMLGGEE